MPAGTKPSSSGSVTAFPSFIDMKNSSTVNGGVKSSSSLMKSAAAEFIALQ